MRLRQRKKSISIFLLVIFSFLALVQSAASSSDIEFPTSEWHVSAPEEQGMQSKTLLDMMAVIKDKKYNFHSVTIVRNGSLVLDSYLYPFENDKKHKMFSATKSVTSALIGIAMDKGYIKDIHQTLTQLFPNNENPNLGELKKSLTLKDLLTMTSGFDCNDGSANQWAGTIAMRKTNDWTQYTLNLPMARKPGETFHYCNGVSHLLSAIIHESTGIQTLAFAKKHLFDPLGINDVKWDKSPEGIVSGSGGLWLQPKDMAKIGLLYLNKGKWEDRQIISTGWVEESTRPFIDGGWNGEDYGYQWWINPAGYYSAVGMFGQAIYVVPGKNLVAVFTSNIEGWNMYISGTLLQEYIIPAAKSSKQLPPDQHEKSRLDDLLTIISKAPAQGIVWSTENEGIAKDGVFKRAASPSFQFEYPLGSVQTKTRQPDQIMRMETPTGGIFTASIYKIPRDMKPEDFGPKEYVSWLKEYVSNITVISSEEIMLKGGTKAYRTDLQWTMKNNKPMTTNLVSAYKDGKCIYIAIHEFQKNKTVEPILQSWTFE